MQVQVQVQVRVRVRVRVLVRVLVLVRALVLCDRYCHYLGMPYQAPEALFRHRRQKSMWIEG